MTEYKRQKKKRRQKKIYLYDIKTGHFGLFFLSSKSGILYRCRYLDTWISSCVRAIETIPYDAEAVRFRDKDYRIKTQGPKQYPNVKKIYIGPDVRKLEISNFMFPNVKEVVSESPAFQSGTLLIEKNRSSRYSRDFDGEKELLNTFCKTSDEVIDLSGIGSIDDYAFEGCRSKKIINMDELFMIDSMAFSGSAVFLSDTINEMQNDMCIIGNTLIRINDNAGNINIPDSVNLINPEIDFSAIENVEMSISALGELFYYHGGQMQTLSLRCPDTMSNNDIYDKLRYSGTHLRMKKILAADGNNKLASVDGIIYTKDMKQLIICPEEHGGDVIIPEGVEAISAQAFNYCNVTSISLPSTLTFIASSAFDNCKMQHINFGAGIKCIERLGRCEQLKKTEIPNQVKNIWGGAFENCTFLEHITLHEGLEEIGWDAFRGCIEMKEIEIPATVKKLGSNCLKRVNKIIFKGDSLPAGVGSALLDDDIPRNLFVYIKKDKYAGMVELVFKGKSYFLPRYVRRIDISKINEILCSTETPVEDILSSLYQFGKTWELKVDAAIKTYVSIKDKGIALYLKKVSKKIAYDYMYANRYEELAKFLDLGFVSKATLKELQKETKVMEIPEVAAVILRELDQKQITPKRFSL